jgi:hypothetical protein
MGAGAQQEAKALLNGEDYATHKTIVRASTDRFIGAVIAAVTADLAAVKQRAFAITIGSLMVALVGGIALWRLLLQA